MTELQNILCQEIRRTGPIPFNRFMELALYCPIFGYYEQKLSSIGARGDYYTSVSVGALFGQLLAAQMETWLSAELDSSVQIVEAGAHDGRLAADLLAALAQYYPHVWERLEYWIIEPSSAREQVQRRTLEHFAARVRWSARFPSRVRGVIFSNELLDAMPVRPLRWDAGAREWREMGVAWEQGRFAWMHLPLDPAEADRLLREAGFDLLPELLSVLPDQYVLEVNPAALQWWREAAGALSQGYLCAIDYGLTAEEWLIPERCEGTLRAYSRHTSNRDVLARPGEQDLTAHVNFTALQRAGEAMGLKTEGLFSQALFFVNIAQRLWANSASAEDWPPERIRQFQTLTHPNFLGRAFRVLVQSRQG